MSYRDGVNNAGKLITYNNQLYF